MTCKKDIMLRAASLAVLALLAGCTPNDTTLGGALRHNLALQVIDPDPQPQTDAIEGGGGERAAAAVKRYNEGTVKQPSTTSTTIGISGAGGGNSGAGSGPK